MRDTYATISLVGEPIGFLPADDLIASGARNLPMVGPGRYGVPVSNKENYEIALEKGVFQRKSGTFPKDMTEVVLYITRGGKETLPMYAIYKVKHLDDLPWFSFWKEIEK